MTFKNSSFGVYICAVAVTRLHLIAHLYYFLFFRGRSPWLIFQPKIRVPPSGLFPLAILYYYCSTCGRWRGNARVHGCWVGLSDLRRPRRWTDASAFCDSVGEQSATRAVTRTPMCTVATKLRTPSEVDIADESESTRRWSAEVKSTHSTQHSISP